MALSDSDIIAEIHAHSFGDSVEMNTVMDDLLGVDLGAHRRIISVMTNMLLSDAEILPGNDDDELVIIERKPGEKFPYDQENCVICLEKFDEHVSNDEQIVKLGCDHVYHKKCVVAWFKSSNQCPTCRKKHEGRPPRPATPSTARARVDESDSDDSELAHQPVLQLSPIPQFLVQESPNRLPWLHDRLPDFPTFPGFPVRDARVGRIYAPRPHNVLPPVGDGVALLRIDRAAEDHSLASPTTHDNTESE